MRIAFLTYEFPDARPGGIGAYVLKCAKALAAAGHDPCIFTLTLPEKVRHRLPRGAHLHEVQDIAQRVDSGMLPPALGAAALIGSQSAYKLLVGALLCDALRSEHRLNPFDIVEAAEWEALALPLLARPILNLPVVVQIHLGSAANWFGNSPSAQERDELAEAVELASIVGADSVCAATQSIVDVTRKLCPFEREVRIIPYPVEIEAGEYSPPPKDGAGLFVGRLQRRKGCAVFAEAAAIFLRRNPLGSIRIAGSDTNLGLGGESMLGEMRAAIDPALRGRFVYLGELSQTEIFREIEACRFQVVPSVVENFANTAIDAMARGRLVIYGGNTGLDEVVGDTGIRVWPLTAERLAGEMERAWNGFGLAQNYAERALDRVRTKFDPAAVSKQRVNFYQEVISAHRAGRSDHNRQWQALSGSQIRAVLNAMILQMSSVLGLEQEIATPGGLLTEILQSLARRLNRPPSVWLFGAGRFTQRLLAERHRWESLGLKIAGMIDEHPRFQQSPLHLGLPVQNPAQLCKAIEDGLCVDAIVLSTDTLEEVFRRQAQCFSDLGIAVLGLSAVDKK